LVNVNKKVLAQTQRWIFAREDEIGGKIPEGTSKECVLRTFVPPSLMDGDEHCSYAATKCDLPESLDPKERECPASSFSFTCPLSDGDRPHSRLQNIPGVLDRMGLGQSAGLVVER
jgi:hypothetical protein